jgi:hypothetical protein
MGKENQCTNKCQDQKIRGVVVEEKKDLKGFKFWTAKPEETK